jgi:hypothetical protein
MSTKQIPWLRWSGEFIIIVLGVLGALAVDEYRDERIERELEREYLLGFQVDLQRDSGALRVGQRRIERSVRVAEQLLLQAGGDLSGHWHSLSNFKPTTLQMEFDAGETRFLSTALMFTPFRGTYTTIVSSGDLHTIRDRALRGALTSYYEGEVRSNADNGSLMLGSRRLLDFLIANGVDVYNREHAPRIPELEGVVPYLSAARDQEHWRLARLQGLQGRYDLAVETLNRVLSEID